MATISDKPWGQFTAADYTPEQWRRACILHLPPAQGQDPTTKSLHKVPVREPDGTLNRNGVHAAAGGHGLPAVKAAPASAMQAAAKELVKLYEQCGDTAPPGVMSMAGMSMGRAREFYDRAFALEGIEILSRAKGGDGRTVEAYAAVFNSPQEINDAHGHYTERIHPTAFARTLANGAASRALLLFNHGRTVVDGRPDSLAQVPIGRSVSIAADGRGLRVVDRYNKSPLAESVLEAIRADDIRGYSFRGQIFRSDPQRVPRARPGQPLPDVARMELGLSDYGPTPTPYYTGAAILAVRSATMVYDDIAGLDESEYSELLRMLATTRHGDPEPETATPHRGPGTEDPRETAHSGRSRLLRLKAEAVFAGVCSGTQAERDHL